MIISFGWTTPALLAGVKTVTRRDWSEKHAAHFKAGQIVDAWNTSPRNVRGNPHKIATIRITQDPYLSSNFPSEDWDREGFEYLEGIGATLDGDTPAELWHYWTHGRPSLYVVRFELVSLEDPT